MRSDRTREEPGYFVGGHPTARPRSPTRCYAGFQMGLSRAAYIVARARYRCATRPFAKTQPVPHLGSHSEQSRKLTKQRNGSAQSMRPLSEHLIHLVLDFAGKSLQTK